MDYKAEVNKPLTNDIIPLWSLWFDFLLPQDDLRRSFAVHAEAFVSVLQDRAHGLAGGVESVDLIELLFGDLVSDWLVVPLQVQH